MTLRNKLGMYIRNNLAVGLTPQRLALTIAIGVTAGILPLIWGTTLLCAALAHRLRLNQAMIQAVNYLCYPLQIVLFLPFYRLGATLFPWGKPVAAENILQTVKHNPFAAATLLGAATVKALCAWVLVAPMLILCLYLLFIRTTEKTLKAMQIGR